MNSEPFPSSLTTQISPPFFLVNSLHSFNPSPEPFSFLVPNEVTTLKSVNIFFLFSSETPIPLSFTEIEIVSLFSRIERMIELGDAYIILSGGTGTLVELSIVWEYVNKKLMASKPIFAHGKMWKPMIETIDKRMEYEKKQTGIVKYLINIEDCVNELLKLL